MTHEAYWQSLKHKIPKKNYYFLIWDANIEDALKGIYFENDYQPIKEEIKRKLARGKPSAQEFIQTIKNNIKASPDWWRQVREKAKHRGISEDSMLTLDALYIFEVKYHNQVPDTLF